MKRVLSGAVVALLLLPTLSRAVPRQLPADPQATVHHGELITPRSFEFSSLPTVSSLPYTGPQTEVHDEGIWSVAEEDLQRQKAHPELLPDLANLGAHVTLDPTAAGGLTPFAPSVGNGFEGITQGPYIPSEPTVAAGPLNIFTAGNVNVTVTNKDGSVRVETDGATFFGVPAGEGAISDAQCYYDAVHGRFVAVAFTEGTTPTNYSNFYLIVSKTNDARGAWWRYKFDMTKDGTTQTSNWSDYESLGLTEDKIVLTGQQFTFSGNAYAYPKARVIDRAAVFAGNTVSYVDFANFAPPSGGDTFDTFVTKCARNLTPGDATAHLMCVRVNGGTNVTYREITGTPASPVLSAGARVTVTAYSVPPDAAQQGTTTLVATNDCRPTDFYVRNGVLLAAWHFGINISGSAVSAVRLFRIRTSDLTVLTDETFGAASTFYYYPAATVDSAGSIYLGFDRSSSTEFPSAYVSGKRTSESSIEPSVLVKAGLSSTSQSRWGDFTGIDNDLSLSGPGGSTAWYAGQWTKGTNTFGTWINRLSFTYGQVGGIISDDCDGSAGTTGDRAPLAGVTLSLLQGVTTLATTTSGPTGAYNFGYLEAGTYDVVVTPPASGMTVDATAGTGGTSQTRVNAGDIQVVVTNSQASTNNAFFVTSSHPAPVTSSISPIFKVVGDPGFTLTVNGSSFTKCSVVRVDGSDRTTTWVSSNQLTALLPSGDMATPGGRAITVFTQGPGGGSSNAQFLTVSSTPDTQAPVVNVTSPAGGESWAVGSTHDITWTATDNIIVGSIDLALSTDGGATFPTALATGISNTGTWSWVVPFTPSTTARVRVSAHDGVGNLGSDSSHVNFTIAGWTVTASASAGGTITPGGATVVVDGATPSYVIAPATGYHIVDVLVNGGSVGAVSNYTFAAVHANQTIAASFAINTYTLTVTSGGNGTVGVSPDQPTYTHGTLVTLTATPTAGFTFAGWSGDTVTATNPLVLPMIANRNISATFGLHTYVWNQTSSAFFVTASNWTPPRTFPSTDDVLIFNNGASDIATNVPTQTIGQLLIGNGTNVSLQAGGTATLTLGGGTGVDLDVQGGSTLQLNSSASLTLALATGATGTIAGTVNATAGSHHLQAVDAGAIVFLPSSSLNMGTGFGGNIFGTGTGTSGLNSVVFQAGTLVTQSAGANPFGAVAPQSVVVFQPGSRFRLDGAITPSLSGRAYADFECNTIGTTTNTGTSAFTMDSLIVTLGTFNVNLTGGGGTIRGGIRVKSGATLGFTPVLGSPTYTLGGTSAQTLAIFGTWTNTANITFAVNNPSGVTLASPWTLSGPLSFVHGQVTTGANTLAIGPTGSVTGASQGTGWVIGNLRRNFATGASSRTFDIGDATTYAPATLSVTGAAAAFDFNATTHAGDHASIALSDLDPSKTVNRIWTLNAVGTPTFTAADATFGFGAGDVDPGANTANFLVRRYSGSWSAPTTGTRTATSTQATGLTAFGDFAVGEKAVYTITASAGANGSITPSGVVPVDPGASQSFAIAPAANYHIADVLVDGSSVGAVPTYLFSSVGASHTIAATFAGNPHALTVNVTGSGTVGRSPDLPSYPHGTTVTLTATPSSGFAFRFWSGDLSGSASPQDLLMDAPKSVTATFTESVAPTVAVLFPNGGELLTQDGLVPLMWNASDNVLVTAVDLLLSRTGSAGAFETLAVGVPNIGSWNWTVTTPPTADAWLKAVAHDAAGNSAEDVSNAAFSIAATSGVDDGPVTAFALAAVHPNPARGEARSVFALPRSANVRVSLIDVQGREVMLLASGEYGPGRHSVSFANTRFEAGLYFLRMRVEDGPTFTRRVVLAR